MDKQIIYNENVTISLETQLKILKKAKTLLIGFNRPKIVITQLLKEENPTNGKLNAAEYYIWGICDAINCASIALKFVEVKEFSRMDANDIICIFNHENAKTFGNADSNSFIKRYWWKTFKHINNKIVRNLAPRIKFIDWMINQLENDIFTRDTLVQ